MNIDRLRAELALDEGKHLLAYRDSLGHWTIGVGHLLGGSPRMSQITEDECSALLTFDIDVAILSACRVFPEAGQYLAGLGDVRGRAVVNMTFNRGEDRMRTSTSITPAIRRGLTEGTWDGIAAVLKASEWGREVGARAVRLGTMLESGAAA